MSARWSVSLLIPNQADVRQDFIIGPAKLPLDKRHAIVADWSACVHALANRGQNLVVERTVETVVGVLLSRPHTLSGIGVGLGRISVTSATRLAFPESDAPAGRTPAGLQPLDRCGMFRLGSQNHAASVSGLERSSGAAIALFASGCA